MEPDSLDLARRLGPPPRVPRAQGAHRVRRPRRRAREANVLAASNRAPTISHTGLEGARDTRAALFPRRGRDRRCVVRRGTRSRRHRRPGLRRSRLNSVLLPAAVRRITPSIRRRSCQTTARAPRPARRSAWQFASPPGAPHPRPDGAGGEADGGGAGAGLSSAPAPAQGRSGARCRSSIISRRRTPRSRAPSPSSRRRSAPNP